MNVRDLTAVFVGGMLGALARWGLDVLIPHTAAGFPWSTLLINVAGSFALGLLTGGVWTDRTPAWVRAGIGPGFLGTFTTFSAAMLAVVVLSGGGAALLAVGYVVATLVLGFGAAAGGVVLGSRRGAA